MAAAVEVYQDKSKHWRFRVKAGNGEIVGLSSEGYSSKEAAARGVEALHYALDSAIATEHIYELKEVV